MEKKSLDARLSQISTSWSILRQAHGGPADTVAAAQQLLLQRYGGAVHRYLLATLRDCHAADDLTQEFGLRLVRGDFRQVTPQRGHFRHYVKTVLFHLVSKYRKEHQARTRPLAPDSPELANLVSRDPDADRRFQESWREELLARAWEALAEAQPVFYAVLRFRAANPKLSSEHMAEQLARQLDKPLTAAGFRQILHRARDKFAELLIDAVAQSVEPPTAVQVEQELSELGLLVYCQPALDRYAREDRG
jgi:RNA polymerase sigma factor (sigma-70 family)